MKTWLITGCSSGLGHALANAVLERGWNAVVTARNVSGLKALVEKYPETAFALELDVRDRPRIAEVLKDAEHRFGGVDVLVNNAGYGYRCAIEEGDEEDVAQLFDTNFFGLVALTKAVLPGMRTRRQGTIVNISSAGGRMSNPGSGYYSATKFAVEGLSDGLRKEVAPLGIRVLIVEPGPFRTDFSGRSLQESRVRIDDYAATVGPRRKENAKSGGPQPGDPKRAADAIIDTLLLESPPRRLVLGRRALEWLRAEVEHQLQELNTWADVSMKADFPDV